MMVSIKAQPNLRPGTLAKSSQRNAQIFALITMASFGMLFGTFLLSFLLAEARNVSWPPIGVEPINNVFAYLATGVIVASSLFYSHAKKSFELKDLKSTKWSLVFTSLLASIFLALQYITLKGMWAQGQSLSSDIYSGSVHVLVGLHAIHLLGGLGGLCYVLAKLFLGPAFNWKPVSDTAVQIVGWFWHFLGVLWGLIFLVLVL